MTDGMGYTEQEWERMWNSETATSTVYRPGDDDEDFCENCQSDVVYSDGYPHGACNCEETWS